VIFDTNDPDQTMIHTQFGRTMQHESLHRRRPERFMRKVKAFFMETVLKG
jgi:hypothetical protein